MTKSKATRISRAFTTLGLWAVLAILASAAAAQSGWKAEGLASWYGPGFDGRKTASGEVFDSSKWTAAHRSLPFGTLVLLTNPANGRRCVVRINDRGPFVEGRLMDLSRAAAEFLGFSMAGIARLSMEEVWGLEPGPLGGGGAVAGSAVIIGNSGVADRSMPSMATSPALGAVYDMQVAAYRDLANARRAVEGLRAAGYSPDIQSSGGYHRVFIRALSAEGLERERERLSSLGFPGVIIRLSTPLR